MPDKSRQVVRYVTASDGVRLAWAESGSGIPLVRAATWLTHLESDPASPVWRHWIAFLSRHFRLIRYDERGCGMTDWDVRDMSLERRVRDLHTVVDAAGVREPFVLLGISHAAAVSIAYATTYPKRVDRMILYGGFARGAFRRGHADTERLFRAIVDLTALWGSDNQAFREVFTSRFIPEGTNEQLRWFNELCRKSTSPALAGTLLRSKADVDVSSRLKRVRTPTLVVHARRDRIAPLSEGHLLASEIAGAQFVELESCNHILLEHEDAWTRFQESVLEFTGQAAAASGHRAFEALSPRERATLSLLTEGLSNAEIAARLGISEKTVRNHLSNLFDKLGVWSRAQAIVFAREHGFTHSA
jgi:pimeloyl-ACP methyl ester carboxylesterase/DNA-binding CsgD family transcriptional regulator